MAGGRHFQSRLHPWRRWLSQLSLYRHVKKAEELPSGEGNVRDQCQVVLREVNGTESVFLYILVAAKRA